MWFTKVIGFAILWAVALNLAGIGWGWYRRDIMEGFIVSVAGGSVGGMVILLVDLAVWILLGSPVS
jgi:hypothetical protein